MIRNIIWDVDGTLFDTYPAFIACFQAALQTNGCSAAPEHIGELVLVSVTHCANTLAAEFGLDPDQLAAGFSAQYAQAPLASQPSFPGVLEVCQTITASGGLNLIATHRSMRTLKLLLEYHQLDQYINACLSAQDGFPQKPDPAMFIELLNRFSLAPENTLAVGDRDLDIQAGAAAGVRACGFGNLFPNSQPDFIIQDYQELLERIKVENMNQFR